MSPGVIHTLQLAKVERYIGRAEQLVAGQRLRVETIKQRGWPDDLSSRLLDTLTASLALLHKHRDIIRKELTAAD